MAIVRKIYYSVDETLSISPERLKKLQSMKDEDIDYSDIPEIDWTKVTIIRKRKAKAISLKVSEKTLDFFKKQGKGYQTKMNEVLDSYVEHSIRR